jgi:hypothetical protein
VSNALNDSHPLAQAEIDLASKVFGNTIPYNKVILTDLGGLSGRGFTAPGVDGKIYCNLGSAYANPLGSHPQGYPAEGQLLIHELTHAWQIAHAGFLPGFVCSAIVTQANYTFGDNVYQYGPAGPPWWSLTQSNKPRLWTNGLGRRMAGILIRRIIRRGIRRATPTTAISGTTYSQTAERMLNSTCFS